MNCLRAGFLIGVLLLCQQCLASICVNTSANREMYKGADVLARGYDMAFQDSHFSDYQLFSADTNAEFVTQIQKMISGSCSIVLGLFTSRDCLIAGPVLEKNKAIGISPICGHNDVNKFYPYLYTTRSLSKEAEVIAAYLGGIANLGKVFVIYQPTNLYSMALFSQFKKGLTNSIVEIPIGSDNQFDLSQFSYQKGEQVTFMFFAYPLPSVEVLVELSNHQLLTKNVRIIGVSSWYDDISVLKSIKPILENAGEVVAPDDLDWKTVKHSAFVKTFIKKFNREPLNVEILNYDVTRFAVKCYKESLVSGKYNIDTFRHCLTNTQYHGVTGVFSFSKQSSFADLPLYFANVFDRI